MRCPGSRLEGFQQLLEVVGRHANQNEYRYRIAEQGGPGEFDIATTVAAMAAADDTAVV